MKTWYKKWLIFCFACVVIFFLQAVSIFFFSQRVLYYFFGKIFFRTTEPVARRCSAKKGVLNTSKNSSGNTCAGVLSFSKVAGKWSSHLKVLLGKGVLKICSKFTGEHPWQSLILIKLKNSFIAITLWHRCFPGNLLHILRTPFFTKHLWAST